MVVRRARKHERQPARIELCFPPKFSLIARMNIRHAHVKRVTNETRIAVKLKLEGSGKASVSTGIAFFDHMLSLFAKHAVIDLQLRCDGDLAVDAHHSVED